MGNPANHLTQQKCPAKLLDATSVEVKHQQVQMETLVQTVIHDSSPKGFTFTYILYPLACNSVFLDYYFTLSSSLHSLTDSKNISNFLLLQHTTVCLGQSWLILHIQEVAVTSVHILVQSW